MFAAVKHSHLLFVAITLILFNLRFWLLVFRPHKSLPKVLKILPHINDTVLLLSGLWLMHITAWVPFGNADWLGWKLLFVLLYILSGMRALKAVPRSGAAWSGYIAALCCAAVVLYLALFKPV
ncbi:MAG: SirB2 family protein [Neisseria sp.]|nr:SirB2 family protein [Neisseria sp.]